MATPNRSWLLGSVFFTMAGCAGNVAPTDNVGGGGAALGGASSGGAASGSTPALGGAALGGATATASSSGGIPGTTAMGGRGLGGASTTVPASGGSIGTGTVCCLAMAVCNPGDVQLAGPGSCPAGATCYSNSICCSTVWCMSAAAQCDAIPTCDAGDTELTGTCPPDLSCYTRSLCGTTINCRRNAEACNPTTEYNRKYVGESPAACQTVRFACAAGTAMFSNDCGCGCEQPSTCPEFVDCMPGPSTRSALCMDSSQCPFTLRAM